jgi:large subunit ribosomal protein L24e
MDSTLEFEKRRNVPLKYDRELMATTISAVSRIQEIKTKREKAFYKNRMNVAKPVSLRTDALEVLSGTHLLGFEGKNSEVVKKALKAAEIKAKKKEKKRIQKVQDQVEEMQQDLEGEEDAEIEQVEDEEMDVEEEQQRVKDKIKVKVPARSKKGRVASGRNSSALMPAGEGGMSMSMGGMHVD